MNELKKRQLYKLLGAKIKFYRSSNQLSQTDLASKLLISRTSVVNIEQGKQQPPLHLLWQIAECLEVDIKNLLPANKEIEEYLAKEAQGISPSIEGIISDRKESWVMDKYKDLLQGFLQKVKSNEKNNHES